MMSDYHKKKNGDHKKVGRDCSIFKYRKNISIELILSKSFSRPLTFDVHILKIKDSCNQRKSKTFKQ